MRGVEISIAPSLRDRCARGRPYAGGPLVFSELMIGAEGAEELLPVDAAEALYPEAREALRRLAAPRGAPRVLAAELSLDDIAERALPLTRAPAQAGTLRLRALEGDAATRARALAEAAGAQISRGRGCAALILDPGPLFTPAGLDRAAFDALPRLLHIGAAPLADLRGAPPGAMGLAAGLCMDRGALLLQADAPASAVAARDIWLRLRGEAA